MIVKIIAGIVITSREIAMAITAGSENQNIITAVCVCIRCCMTCRPFGKVEDHIVCFSRQRHKFSSAREYL